MNTLVTDFDGTMTRQDFFQLVIGHAHQPEMTAYWEAFVAGELTHFEALRRIFLSMREGEAALRALADRMDPDPDLARAISRLQSAGWRVVVASAGCRWYIDRVLACVGVEVEVHANHGRVSPEGGLEMIAPVESPFFLASTGIDKAGIVRSAIAGGGRVAFAGDGRPDIEAALLVEPTRRFARGWLREHFQSRGVPCAPFPDWSRLADTLLNDEEATE